MLMECMAHVKHQILSNDMLYTCERSTLSTNNHIDLITRNAASPMLEVLMQVLGPMGDGDDIITELLKQDFREGQMTNS